MSHVQNNLISHNEERTIDFKVRNNKTYQDSNIFGNKSLENNTITAEAKGEIAKESLTKHNPTFSSSIFSEKIDTMEQKIQYPNNTNNYNNPSLIQKFKIQDHTNEQLFGNYRETQLKTHEEEMEQYIPKYPSKTANDRKNLEIYGCEIEKQPRLEFFYSKKSIGNEEPPLERKIAEQSSNIFNQEFQEKAPTNYKKKDRPFTSNTVWNDPSTEKVVRKEEQVDEKNYAYNRKIDEMNSIIFGEQQVKKEKKIPENNNYQDKINAEKRKKNKNFSDLFGITNYENDNKIPKSIMASNLKWNQVDSFKQNPFKQESTKQSKENMDNTANCLKHRDLQSVLDTHEFEYKEVKQKNKNEEILDKKFVVDKNTKARDLVSLQNESRVLPGYTVPSQEISQKTSEIYDFDIKGLDNYFEENKFKKFCMRNGYHIVEFKHKFNNIMNTISSEGRIKIRATDDSDSIQITDKLKTLGLEVIPHQEKNNKANNFLYVNNLDWKEGNLQIEEKRLHSKNYINAKDSKMKDLESNGEIFGSGKGVGKWNEEWKKNEHIEMKKDQERKGMGQEDFLNYGNWNKAMKKLDYKMKKITPLLKKSSKDNANMKVFEPLSQRINKPIK